MLRITRQASDDSITLRIEGRIASEWALELERECRVLLAQGRRIALDFQDVRDIDRRGCRILRALTTHGIRIVNSTPLIDDVLRNEEEDDDEDIDDEQT